MSRKAIGSGSKFVRYFGPLLEALRGLGGSAKPAEVYQAIAARMRLTDEALSETMRSGRQGCTIKSPGRVSILSRPALLTHRVVAYGPLPRRADKLASSLTMTPCAFSKRSALSSIRRAKMMMRGRTRKRAKRRPKADCYHPPLAIANQRWNG